MNCHLCEIKDNCEGLPCPEQRYECGTEGMIYGQRCDNFDQEKQQCKCQDNVICDHLKPIK